MLEELTDWVTQFPGSLKDSLRWYTTPNYLNFNRALRNGESLTGEQKLHFRNLDFAFEIIPPLTKPLIVYKGKNSEKLFNDPAFISASLDFDAAHNFVIQECCLLEITVVPGSKVLPIYYLSQYPNEQEILLDRNGILMKTGEYLIENYEEEYRTEDIHIIQVTYLPGNSRLFKNGSD